MYAVVRSGGRQYKVSKSDLLRVAKLANEEGELISMSEVLMVIDGEQISVGDPLVSGAEVTARVEKHGLGRKIDIIKFQRRKNHRRHNGHRQPYTELRITDIKVK